METQGSHTPQGWMVGLGVLAVGADAVQGAGDDARGGGLAHAAHAGQHEGMGDAAGGEGVGQGAHQRLLPDQAGEIGGAVFARQDAIGLWSADGHGRTIASRPGTVAAIWRKIGDERRRSRSDEKGGSRRPAQIRYGCFVPDLTRLATATSTDFRAGI